MDTRTTVVPTFTVIFGVALLVAVIAAVVVAAVAPPAFAAIEKPPSFESVVAGDGDHLDAATRLAVGPDGTLYGCGSIWHDATGYDITITRYDDAPLGWTRTWNGAGRNADDSAVDIAVAADGAIYVYGSEAGGEDAQPVLLKYSSTGDRVWVAHEASRPWGYAGWIALDGDGNVYACSKEDNEGSGGTIGVLTKYRPDGTVAWAQDYGINTYKPDMGSGHLCVADNGIAYVGGSVEGTDIGQRAFLVSFSAGGRRRWTRLYAGPGKMGAWFSTLAPFPSGGVYAVGAARSDASDILVTRYTAAGTRVLTRRLGVGDGRRQWASDAAVGSLGRIAVCGGWRRSGKGFYVVLLRRDGSVRWSHNFRGDNVSGFAKGVVVDTADRVCVTGNAPGTQGATYNPGRIATYAFSRTGVLRWSSLWPTALIPSNGPEPRDIAAYQTSNVWVCGSSDDRPGTGPDQFVIGWGL
jgi:hypothetical protein